MSRCRVAWYERGRVTRHVAHAQRTGGQDAPSAESSVRTGPNGIKVVEAEIDGSMWYGRLTQKQDGRFVGPVLLFERPPPQEA